MPKSETSKNSPAEVTSAEPRNWKRWALPVGGVLLVTTIVLADYFRTLPETVAATYVGRNRCIECHQDQMHQWEGSHHDLAMDRATPDTVLGDFNDAQLEHYGITSTMFRDGDKFMVHTEGPDGTMANFEVKYVFGVEPLQQYMVEFDRAPDQSEDEIARLQVLRISWDTTKQKWFYLSPPDVDEKLAPDDDLHWTGIAQRWNNMCADCHSTNLRRGYDASKGVYHTTFSEMDVSCEACHGPGSVHIELANRKSLFWDRKRGYALARLKDKDPEHQVTACAPCHSRRRVLKEGYHAGDNFYDHFSLENLSPQTYHSDGQILDEVYVTGSFLQSKMYHKGIRCTDCHDPHTTKLKQQGNLLCTSCHQHPAGRYDNPAHHFHKVGSEGAKCVNCHMPSTTYMEVDPRRDHSLRIPRPDLSVKLGNPNVCTGCHLKEAELPDVKKSGLKQYKDWLLAANPMDGSEADDEVSAALKKLDQWASDQCDQWYGADRDSKKPHFAEGLAAAWKSPEDASKAVQRWSRPTVPALIRSSLLQTLLNAPLERPSEEVLESLSDPHPAVRAAAAGSFENLIPSAVELGPINPQHVRQLASGIQPMAKPLWPLLKDPVRSVRIEAARVLARVPADITPLISDHPQRMALKAALKEFKESLLVANDRGGSHAVLGSLYENLGDDDAAEKAYRTAIRVEPQLTGPRTNLAAMFDRQAEALRQRAQQAVQQRQENVFVKAMSQAEELTEKANEFRRGELPLLKRDAKLAPNNAAIQHRLGMALYLNDDLKGAEAAFRRSVELDGDAPRFVLMLTLLLEKMERFNDAVPYAKRLVELAPDDESYKRLLNNIQARSVIGPQP